MSQFVTSNISGGAIIINTLTGDSGGPVSPTLGNINILGGAGIAVAGNPGTSTLTISATGSDILAYTDVNSSPYVVLATDEFLSVDCSGGAITVQLPDTPVVGQVFYVKDRTGNANTFNITVTTVSGATLIDGAATYVMNTQYAAISIVGGSSVYQIF